MMVLRGSVYSKILEMETGITVLAPGRNADSKPRQVAYLLHGLCGTHSNWLDYTMLPVCARDLDVVFVMPDVGRSFYSDMRHGQQFFTYVADELPALCRGMFNISSAREDTVIIGGSMGGYGALKIALRRPDRFRLCCALAPATLFLKQALNGSRSAEALAQAEAEYGPQLIRDFKGIYGEELDVNPDDDLPTLAERAVDKPLKPIFRAVCGTDDPLCKENARFARLMAGMGFDYHYEEMPGDHDWEFFDAALRRAVNYSFGKTTAF